MIEGAAAAGVTTLPHPVHVMTAGSAPPAPILRGASALGLEPAERARRLGRQGVCSAATDAMMVADPHSLVPVPHDGTTMGEAMIGANLAMKGYFKDPDATDRAFAGGWCRTGDLAVMHADGYMELKDRSKDIIAFCRGRLAGFKAPREVRVGPIERTATEKMQKFKLRTLAGKPRPSTRMA